MNTKLDLAICVDRLAKPSYPKWVSKLVHPELELKGPAKYSLSKVGLWLHDDQMNDIVGGQVLYDHLKKTGALSSCLNLQDGLAMQGRGVEIFRKFFDGKVVFLWGSVVQGEGGKLFVPSLVELGGEVSFHWRPLVHYWGPSNPALRFKKKFVRISRVWQWGVDLFSRLLAGLTRRS